MRHARGRLLRRERRHPRTRDAGEVLARPVAIVGDLRLGAAKGALLRKSRLQGARLAGANLHDAVLAHADLRGADLRGSNLFGADLSRVWLNDQTQFEGALTTRARTWPRWSAEQQAVGPQEG